MSGRFFRPSVALNYRGRFSHGLRHGLNCVALTGLNARGIRQAESRLAQARRSLEQAELNLRYCDVLAEIDGVVTQRALNPGNNVIAGQSLMALWSLTQTVLERREQFHVLRLMRRSVAEKGAHISAE